MDADADPFVPDASDADAGDLTAEVERRPIFFGPEHHGQRLDRALTALVPEFSRSWLARLVGEGAVSVGGQVVTRPARPVRAGEHGCIELRPTPQSQAFVPEPMALDVRYEDEHLLVLAKPVGLVVHPAPGHWRGTLLNALLARDPRAAALPRAGIVHRLDRDTSGLMVVARTRVALESLVRQIAARTVRREYHALVHGPWRGEASRWVDAPIGRDPRNRLRMAVVDAAMHPAKPARTHVTLLGEARRGGPGCWVRCALETGRTHQIRVHMAHIGHPLVGDALYGGAAVGGLMRQALHATRLALDHPLDGRALLFEDDLPADMCTLLEHWDMQPVVPLADRIGVLG